MWRKHTVSSEWGLPRLLTIPILTFVSCLAGATSFTVPASVCDYINIGAVTSERIEEVILAGPVTAPGLWDPELDKIPSCYIVQGWKNEDMPDGGLVPPCPPWPPLYSTLVANFWDTSFTGTKMVEEGEEWVVMGRYDIRHGDAAATYQPTGALYTRTMNMMVLEHVWFEDISPTGEEAGEPQ